jgi:predicted RNase H-like HicB family nuclease
MGHLIVVRATWDREASVWTAESPDLPGLVTEASSLDELDRKLPGLIQDLMEDDDDGEMDIPVEVVASFSKRVRVRARAA